MRGTKIVFSRSLTAESTVGDARKNIMCALDLSLEMQRVFTGALTLVFEQEGAYKGPYSDVKIGSSLTSWCYYSQFLEYSGRGRYRLSTTFLYLLHTEHFSVSLCLFFPDPANHNIRVRDHGQGHGRK